METFRRELPAGLRVLLTLLLEGLLRAAGRGRDVVRRRVGLVRVGRLDAGASGAAATLLACRGRATGCRSRRGSGGGGGGGGGDRGDGGGGCRALPAGVPPAAAGHGQPDDQCCGR